MGRVDGCSRCDDELDRAPGAMMANDDGFTGPQGVSSSVRATSGRVRQWRRRRRSSTPSSGWVVGAAFQHDKDERGRGGRRGCWVGRGVA